MKNFYIIILILLGIKTSAQEFYITSYDYSTYLNTIKYIDANLNATPVATFYFLGDQILDIAYAPDGKLYGTISDAIIELDLANGTSNEVYQFPLPGNYNSLVCNSNNEIVALDFNSQRLITIDLATFTEVSNIYLGESSPGDLTFYKGNLIFESASSSNVIGYHGTNLKTVACGIKRLSGEYFQFLGFSNYTDSCDNNFVYGFSEDGYVYSYNIESQTNEEVGELIQNYTGPINGATSINEYTASACPLQELDEVNCNLDVFDQALSNLLFYPNPVEETLHVQNSNTDEELYFKLYSQDGRMLIKNILTPEIDFSKFSSGVYFMEIYNKSKSLSTTKKIIKN